MLVIASGHCNYTLNTVLNTAIIFGNGDYILELLQGVFHYALKLGVVIQSE